MTENKIKTRKLVAADLLLEKHPLHKSFLKFCGDNEPSKRQARKMLQLPKFATYRNIDVSVENPCEVVSPWIACLHVDVA